MSEDPIIELKQVFKEYASAPEPVSPAITGQMVLVGSEDGTVVAFGPAPQ